MGLLTIQPNFKIPDNYQRLFMLFGDDWRYVIIADPAGLHSGQMGKIQGRDCSICLDWIQEAIEGVRF